MAINERKFIKMIKKEGFKFERQAKGSHEIWSNGDKQITIVRGRDLNRMIARRLLKSIGSKELSRV